MSVTFLVSSVGLFLLIARFGPLVARSIWPPSDAFQLDSFEASPFRPLVTIVVPVRNEERNLPRLFDSLEKLNWRPLQIIFVDDQSTDRTASLLRKFQCRRADLDIKRIEGCQRPEGWTGKNWACTQAVEQITGEFILFTDADTWHEPSSLAIAMRRMCEMQLDLFSAIPFHRTEALWEKWSGPFHVLILFVTGAFSRPRSNRLFAIGQYLLFRREWYERHGGHVAVHDRLCEDLELAAVCLREGGRYYVETEQRLFQVRMYASLSEFMQGWRRNIRLGLRHSRVWASLELYALLSALTAGGRFFFVDETGVAVIMVLCFLLLLAVQARLGDFSPLGVLLFPFSLGLFIWVSFLAVVDLLLHRQYAWRGRSYKTTGD